MKTRSGQAYEFGPYRLDFGEQKLWRGEEEVKLRPKLFDLLSLLVRQHGQMLHKEELIKQLWPDTAVEENNLTVSVNALRAILHDGQYIETLTRRGYRFVADVKVVSNKAATGFSESSRAPEPPGGAVPLHSPLYVARPADEDFCTAITRRDSIVLVKGARQVGKTSLLARGLDQARGQGADVVVIDFQQFNSSAFESLEKLLLAMAELIAYQLEVAHPVQEAWSGLLGPSSNFERYLRREVFASISSHLVLALDEVDRLFSFDYAGELFGLFRSWHNLRALDPEGAWHRLTLAIAYATEAHLFISDLNQSPFNVGTRLTLVDFTLEHVVDLNSRYGEPLRDATEIERFHNLIGGHPYLTQRGLYEIATGRSSLDEIHEQAGSDEGAFGDHLKRMLVSLEHDRALLEELRGFLQSASCLGDRSFSRLRIAGIVSGDSAKEPRIRCDLYARYLRTHLA